MKTFRLILFGIGFAAFSGVHAEVSETTFGDFRGQPVDLYTLRAKSGIEAKVMTYGATLTSLKTRDRNGKLANIVLGFDSFAPYVAGVAYLGATVGRYANRIAQASFKLDGKDYSLPKNDGQNSLHGGTQGFDKRLWTVEKTPASNGSELRLTLVSAAGDQGYPGQVTVHVTYQLREHSLEIDYEATSSAATPINLANHAYFNLSGDPSRTILEHTLKINATRFTPIDANLIPTGELRQVAGTPFDFRTAHPIGERVEASDEQLNYGKGYDHNWVLARTSPHGLDVAAILSDPASGRTLEIRTTQPGIQFYSGNFLDGRTLGGHEGFQYRTGLCLETQHFPDSTNQGAFPSTILRPGQTYRERTLLTFDLLSP